MEDKTENEQSVGSRLLELRTQNNLTQEELAERLAVSRQSVSKWELNKTLPDVDRLIQLSDMYEVSIDYLVKGIQNTEMFEDDLTDMEEVSTNVEEMQQENFNDAEEASLEKKADIELYAKKNLLFGCMLLSGILCIGMLFFEGKLLLSSAFQIKNKEQGLAVINRIYEQYTKAEVSTIDDSGKINKEVVWMDIPGVREDDFVEYYYNAKNHDFLFEYYPKTLIMPMIAAIIFMIFLIVFWLEWKDYREKLQLFY